MTTNDQVKYIEGIGRRKSATARVRITPSNKSKFTINDKPINEYFKIESLIISATKAISTDFPSDTYSISARVSGGGINSQADAIKLGLARAIIKHKPDIRKEIKKAKLLKRDPREVERKMFGKKKSRKSPQWSKR